ncbi:50S ribosomal protein L35ae [Candidatus Woesearchaeota archaeon]|nr:50S ribosomal protein L35ae [Candidatus Woesearchaeota archaeon]
MEGVIASFRRGRRTQNDRQMIIVVKGIDNKEKATSLVGKKVIFTTESGKELIGKVSAPHGAKGAVRAIFETGMPGQSLSKKVKIE